MLEKMFFDIKRSMIGRMTRI